MKTRIFVTISLLAVLASLRVSSPSHAANPTETLTITSGTCTNTSFDFKGLWNWSNFPAPFNDNFVQTINGSTIGSGAFTYQKPNFSGKYDDPSVGSYGQTQPYSITETNVYSANGSTFLKDVFNGTCNGGVVTGTFSIGNSSSSFSPGDNRLNADAGAPAVVYPSSAGFDIYAIDSQSNGVFSFRVTCADIVLVSATPSVNTIIKQSADGKIRLYRLTTGEFQINARQTDGKDYVSIWQGSQCHS